MMILESKNIGYSVVDITEPTCAEEKDFMQANATEKGITVSDTDPRHPLPPQIFNGTVYCGDYNSFELANECDTLEQFLKLEVQKNGSSASTEQPTSTPAPAATEDNEAAAVAETNGDKNGVAEEAVPETETESKPVEEVGVTNDTPAEAPTDGGDSGADDSGAGDSGAGDASAD